MEVIYTITFRGMKLNKKRTLFTILTIILSVGMMTAVLCGLWSMLGFLQTKEKAYGGDYEYSIEQLSLQQAEILKNKENVSDVSLFSFMGNSFYGEKSNKRGPGWTDRWWTCWRPTPWQGSQVRQG